MNTQSKKSKFAEETNTQVNFLKELANKYNLVLSYENVEGTVFETVDDMKKIFDNFVFFTFDPAHAKYLNLEPLSFKKVFKYLVNIHVYDVLEGAYLGDWLPVGLGEIGWKKITHEIKK